jgi:hypothetical protein
MSLNHGFGIFEELIFKVNDRASLPLPQYHWSHTHNSFLFLFKSTGQNQRLFKCGVGEAQTSRKTGITWALGKGINGSK